MPHDRLNGLRVGTSDRQPRAASVPETLKIEHLAVVVLHVEKIAGLPIAEFRRALPNLFQPFLPGRGEIAQQHSTTALSIHLRVRFLDRRQRVAGAL